MLLQSGECDIDQCLDVRFRERKAFGGRGYTSTLDTLISCLIDDAVQFLLEVLSVFEHLLLLGLVVGVVKGSQPVGIDVGGEVLANE